MKKILIFALSLLIMVGSFSATSFAAAVDEATGKTNYAFGVADIDFSGYYTSADDRIANLTNGVYSGEDYCGSNDSATSHTVEIDLGESKYIDEVKLYHGSGGGKPYYTISVSTDGVDYTPVGTTGAYASYCTTLSFTETKARYVRATFTDNKDMKTRLVEIEVLGTPSYDITSSRSSLNGSGCYTGKGWSNAFDGDLTTMAQVYTGKTPYHCEVVFNDYYVIDKVVVYSTINKNGMDKCDLRLKDLTSDADAEVILSVDSITETISVSENVDETVTTTNYNKYTVDFPVGSIAKSVDICAVQGSYINEVTIYGKKVEAPTMGNITETADSEADTTTVKLDVINGGTTDITGNVYAAIYDDNDMLSAVYKTEAPVTVAAGSYTTLQDIELTAASGNLKLFLWDDKLNPLCPAR